MKHNHYSGTDPFTKSDILCYSPYTREALGEPGCVFGAEIASAFFAGYRAEKIGGFVRLVPGK